MESASLSQKKPREKESIESGVLYTSEAGPSPATVDSTQIQRHFTSSNQDPFLTVKWSRRDARAGNFFQADVEFPTSWSDSAVGIVSKLYFATVDGARESSLKTLIKRVVSKISDNGGFHGYFKTGQDEICFEDELTYILLHQMASFNTPVWLNLGVPNRQQTCSACFILNVEDKMLGPESITDWWATEAAIFKAGSGSGINLSKIRGSMEPLSIGGIASGPVAYMRPADAGAGTMKSGGAHRRAAKIVQLNVDHPDILDFIDSKVREDKRMRALSAAGFNLDPSTPEGEKNIAECTSFQNANISVRLSDDFMERVEENGLHSLLPRKSSEPIEILDAESLLKKIAEATWQCADPGIMFDDTINAWHTTPSLGRINASNPCGELATNDNSSCNLSSMNLVKFLNDDNSFKFDDFYQVVDVMITAMDITCSFSDLPTKKLWENTRNLRQLGLGYANLGAALMIQGMPYDSDEGRDWAASVTSLMTGRAYRRSAELASQLEPFLHYKDNEKSVNKIIHKHWNNIPDDLNTEIWDKASDQFDDFQIDGAIYKPVRNSQVSLLAPTGTISFMMDCDTTGCEPAYSLVSYKKLAAGGSMTLVNKSVARSLENLNYSNFMIKNILSDLETSGKMMDLFSARGGNTQYRPEHDKIFQTAAGENSISPDGHIKMLAAIQPHLSGAISKTVNLPESATVEDIYDLYIEAWKLGIKCVAVYRDGSKATQVLSTKKEEKIPTAEKSSENVAQTKFLIRGVYFKSGEEFWEGNKFFQVQEDGSVCERILGRQSNSDSETIINKDQVLKSGLNGLHKWELIKKEQEKNPLWKLHNNEISKVSSRKKMPTERTSLTHKFSIGEYEGYITAGMYEDGTLGEIFLNGIGKEGSTLRGVMDALAMSISIGLQHGVPLETLAQKFSHMDFEPKGLTNNPEIRVAKSMPDYIMRWLVSKFGDDDLCEELGIRKEKKLNIFNMPNLQKEENLLAENLFNTMNDSWTDEKVPKYRIPTYEKQKLNKDDFEVHDIKENSKSNIDHVLDHGKACVCGSLMNRVGTCWSCRSCGASTGCS